MSEAVAVERTMRWENYLLVRGAEFREFWREHLSEKQRRLLIVMGRGFDPRTPEALQAVCGASTTTPIDVLGFQFDEGDESPSQPLQPDADENWAKVEQVAGSRGRVRIETIQFRTPDGRRVGSRNAANIFSDHGAITGYTDIVVDVSAMPRAVYFPLIARLLYFYDELKQQGQSAPNVHVIVSEDPELDFQIKAEGIDENASFLHPFEGEFSREATGQYPKVWIPVMGEGHATEFDRIFDLVKPDEVCPVLPSPARNPRRGDDIVLEYFEPLFDQLRVDPKNILYCSEYNPFEVYRQIRRAAFHYHDVLELVGGCKIALSALCSKLMSLGILLVAYELKSTLNIGIAHIDCQGYEMPEGVPFRAEQVGLWLAGECYG